MPRYRRRSSPRPRSLQIVVIVTALLNVLVRIVRLFRSNKKTNRTDSSGQASPSKKQDGWIPPRDPSGIPSSSSRSVTTGTDGGIGTLFKQKKSNVIVQAAGEVVHLLPDDNYDVDGSGLHQNFLVQLLGNITVKVSHNLNFGRVPVSIGDIVSFKGEYEWTDRGGTIHWTHRDPKGWHEDGWIEVSGNRYG